MKALRLIRNGRTIWTAGVPRGSVTVFLTVSSHGRNNIVATGLDENARGFVHWRRSEVMAGDELRIVVLETDVVDAPESITATGSTNPAVKWGTYLAPSIVVAIITAWAVYLDMSTAARMSTGTIAAVAIAAALLVHMNRYVLRALWWRLRPRSRVR